MSEIRKLLKRCRYGREEIAAIRKQIEFVEIGAYGGKECSYYEHLKENELQAMLDISDLEALLPKILDPRNRAIIRYYYIVGIPERVIGEILGITQEWVRKRRYATIKELENCFGESNITEKNER